MMDHNGELIVPLLTDTRTCLTPIPSGHSRPPEPGPLRHSTGNSAVQQIPQSSPRASFVGRFPFSFSLPNVSSSYKRCLSLSSESLGIDLWIVKVNFKVFLLQHVIITNKIRYETKVIIFDYSDLINTFFLVVNYSTVTRVALE